ncbi:hypothetical protein [Halovivax limisalsi]|uniref:hypothetical protein n=1 Tax=Halovivax limisalsi TaxID=1453760 RepID=UPI001FFC87F9|nr:hypothetical protein [Halovivax limisalsi]
MVPQLTEADVGKRVERHTGDPIGVVTDVADETVFVDPDPDALDSIAAAVGWAPGDDAAVPVRHEVIASVTDEAIRLDADLAVQGGTVGTASGTSPDVGDERDPTEPPSNDQTSRSSNDSAGPSSNDEPDPSAAVDEPAADLAVDPTEATGGDPEAEIRRTEDVGSRTDAAGPTDESTTADADIEPVTEPRRTDAAVTSEGTPRQDEPELEPDPDSVDASSTRDAADSSGPSRATDDPSRRPAELAEFRDAADRPDETGEIDEPAEEPTTLADPGESHDRPTAVDDLDEMDAEPTTDDVGSEAADASATDESTGDDADE